MKETKAQIMAGVGDVTSSKVIGNNTVEYHMANGERVIRFHHTDIITFKVNGDVVLDSGGWKTPTTKERMNNLIGDWRIWQENSIWYLGQHGHWEGRHWVGNPQHPFADGITIHPDGTVTGQGDDPKKTLKLKREVKKYVAGFMAELEARKVPKPSGGDCWFCVMGTQDGKTLGEATRDDHILSHIKERYYVPSLLTRAVEVIPTSQATRNMVRYWMGYHDQEPPFSIKITHEQVRKALTRYIYRQVGMAS